VRTSRGPFREGEAGMLLPAGVRIDGNSGAVAPSTGSYTKKLRDLTGLYRDKSAFQALVQGGDPVAYEVIDYRWKDSDLAFGTTIMAPGKVGDEYFMTRGHFHERRECGETYYTQSGEGILLLQSRDGETRTVEMKPGICAFIPPDWAHRSINPGAGKLVFVWHCATDAGHEYGEILEKGMRKLVVERNGRPAVVDNPNYVS
jgi:glucose-6-phosphate isomerase